MVQKATIHTCTFHVSARDAAAERVRALNVCLAHLLCVLDASAFDVFMCVCVRTHTCMLHVAAVSQAGLTLA
jgi:hypothetical protein